MSQKYYSLDFVSVGSILFKPSMPETNDINQPIFREKDGWILAMCRECYGLNYIEPKCSGGYCPTCDWDTEHAFIPYEFRDESGTLLIKQPRIDKTLGLVN